MAARVLCCQRGQRAEVVAEAVPEGQDLSWRIIPCPVLLVFVFSETKKSIKWNQYIKCKYKPMKISLLSKNPNY